MNEEVLLVGGKVERVVRVPKAAKMYTEGGEAFKRTDEVRDGLPVFRLKAE